MDNTYQKHGNTVGSFAKYALPVALKLGNVGAKEWVAMEAAQQFAKRSGIKYDQPQDQAAIRWGVDKAASRKK
jgi:hypothetical protein